MGLFTMEKPANRNPCDKVAVSRGQRHQLLVSGDQQRLPAFTVRGTPRARNLIVAEQGSPLGFGVARLGSALALDSIPAYLAALQCELGE
jgi:hypothetical protein